MKPRRRKADKKQAEKLFQEQVSLGYAMGLVALEFLSAVNQRPKDPVQIHQKRAGPWRGKGSFGKGFGPNKVKHR